MEHRIRILATSDVHGYIYPYNYANGNNENYGLAKLNTLISSLKDENTILIDNGDVLEGSPLLFYHMHYKADTPNPVARVMKAMHYDFINIGNHDYNYGEEALKNYLKETGIPCITGNILYQNQPYDLPYAIRTVCGKKLLFFGMTTAYIENWEKKEHTAHSVFLDPLTYTKALIKKVKKEEEPDYIIGVYHGGFERDLTTGEESEPLTGENQGYAICKEIPEIDILITGHQHRSLQGKLFHTVYTQTADKGKELACIDINLKTEE